MNGENWPGCYGSFSSERDLVRWEIQAHSLLFTLQVSNPVQAIEGANKLFPHFLANRSVAK